MRSLTSRITFLFATLVTATTAAVLWVGGWLQSRQALAGLDFLNAAEFEEISHRLGENPRELSAAQVGDMIQEHAQIDASLYFFQVRNASGTLLFRSLNLGPAILPDALDDAPNRTADVAGLGRLRIAEFLRGDLRVLVASSLDPAERLLGDYQRISVLLLMGVGLVSVGLGWTFARFTLRPVRAIRETASRIGANTLTERIPIPPGRDELTALAELLNQMFDRLEASFGQVQRFTADASHELKTPLALLRLNAEKLRAQLPPDQEPSETVSQMLEDIDALRRVIESLLFLAQADSGNLRPALAETELAPLVRSVAEDALVLADYHAVKFVLRRADEGRIACEPTLIRQLLINLIGNACRVLPAGGTVELESIGEVKHWRLIVSDDGPGVPGEQLTRIFERFVRIVRPGKIGNDDGYGLGLAICRSIAALHGGTIRAENRPDSGGLRVSVELPRHAGADERAG